MNTTTIWNDKAKALLVGRKIVAASYMTQEEADDMGWYSRPLVIQLDDGTLIFSSADDEGNNGGALFTSSDNVPVLPVL
jgi:hypothetical protein